MDYSIKQQNFNYPIVAFYFSLESYLTHSLRKQRSYSQTFIVLHGWLLRLLRSQRSAQLLCLLPTQGVENNKNTISLFFYFYLIVFNSEILKPPGLNTYADRSGSISFKLYLNTTAAHRTFLLFSHWFLQIYY